MTQADLADRLGVTRQTVIATEQGRHSLEVAFQIARVFNVPLDDVFGYRDTDTHPQPGPAREPPLGGPGPPHPKRPATPRNRLVPTAA
ncbi:helix-turn-helix transcriptional regulator [Nonomuraea polychroma]|uniref:helix-turn-helix transcriptional regulator n=1 Tax=Nonomuraea polychroma TaxID=46176 RepID=UPI0019D4E290|nr:helix-turn-helix transcriptional regulator [Nonomuraea polychroma]